MEVSIFLNKYRLFRGSYFYFLLTQGLFFSGQNSKNDIFSHQNTVDFFLNMYVNVLKVNKDNFCSSTIFLMFTNHTDLHTKLPLAEGDSMVSSRKEITVPTLICKQQNIQPK